MPLQVSLLRRWLAGGAILIVLVVAGAYFIAKWRIENVLKEVPEKIGIEVQQSAQGFTISKSEAGRTIFKVQASKAVQFKQGERATLHDVNITLYGPDSKRFDQIYGSDFEYDPHSGDIRARGEVQIDLEANPEGLAHPDQSVPAELINPIHVKTSGLVFNRNSGNAYTKEKVEFSTLQAHGSATGAAYEARTSTLTLQSGIQAVVEGVAPASVWAARAQVTRSPRALTFERARGQTSSQRFDAGELRIFLRDDNTVERALASGQVLVKSKSDPPAQVNAAQLELQLTGKPPTLKTATFSGDVRWQALSPRPMKGRAEKVVLDFAAKNLLAKIHTEGNVVLEQPPGAPSETGQVQSAELRAQAVDFFPLAGKQLQRAETLGPGQVVIRNSGTDGESQTLVTANRLDAGFDHEGRLSAFHGSPQARLVNSGSDQPDRVSTSDGLEVAFHDGQVETIVQQGHVAYDDGTVKAWGNRALYSVAKQMLTLTGSPRVAQAGMTTTASTVQVNRATGNAVAQGDVKSTYSDLKPQPDGALLASSDPVHVTAPAMTANRATGIVDYRGGARLWQGANIVEAPSINFDRTHRAMVASGSTTQPVSTTLLLARTSQPRQEAAGGNSTTKTAPAANNSAPTQVAVTASRLSYVDSERRAVFTGSVVAKSADATINADEAEVFLQAEGQVAANESLAAMGKLDRIAAQGHVTVTQPGRRATGNSLLYTVADDRFVLSGGPPSIFDAEHGKITGVSLTFFRRDDRVLVDGNATAPAVTQTRLAR